MTLVHSRNIGSKETAGTAERVSKRSRAERLGRFARLASHFTLPESKNLEGEAKINFVLEHTSPEGALEFLQHVNSRLRQGGKKSEIYGDETHRMMVDGRIMGGSKELVAPEPDLQKELFAEYLEAIKKTEGQDEKAALAYYAINNLHLFSDGNGRTSRAVYSLIKNGDLSYEDNEVLEHRTDAEGIPWRRADMDADEDEDFGAAREAFLDKADIKPVEVVDRLANLFLREELCDEGALDEKMRDKTIYIYSVAEKGGLVGGGLVYAVMPDTARDELSAAELKQINYALSDGGGGTTLAGLALASALCERGQGEETLEKNLYGDKRLGLRVNFDEEDTAETKDGIEATFANWQSEDYRNLLKTYRDLKKRQNETIMRFFVEGTKADDGTKVADWICGKV